jgi:hypothetical protein
MGTVVKVALGVLLALTVLIVGCVALIGAGADEVVDEMDRQQRANSITLEQYRSVETGIGESELEERFGEPADAQEFESEIPEIDEQSTGSCVYYNRRGGEVGDVFQFCFDDGRLTSKNSY